MMQSNGFLRLWAVQSTGGPRSILVNTTLPASCFGESPVLDDGSALGAPVLAISNLTLSLDWELYQVQATCGTSGKSPVHQGKHGVEWASWGEEENGEGMHYHVLVRGAGTSSAGDHAQGTRATVQKLVVTSEFPRNVLPAVLTPLTDGALVRWESLGDTVDFDMETIGFLNAAKAPFYADPTCSLDSTLAINRAIQQATHRSLSVFLPAGNYCVSGTI